MLTDQDRRFVFVVGEGDVAMRKDVQLGVAIDGLRVVESGLAAGDRVVVNGVSKIFFPGQALQPREVPMDQPNQPAPTPPGGTAAPANGG